jgi:hypothetical protein
VIIFNDASTLTKIPLDKGLARSKNLYLIKHNTHKRQTSIPPVKFEPATPAIQLLQTYTIDVVATNTSNIFSNLD